MVILLSRNFLLITRISLIAILVIRIELLVRRSSRKDFFSKECITFESLEKNHFFLKSQEKIENSYLKNENSHYQVMHERVLLEKITFVLIFWEDKPFQKSQKKNENPCDKNEDSSYQNGIFWDIFFFKKKWLHLHILNLIW